MTPIPTLETERLILRANRPEDLEPYVAFYASPRADNRGGRRDRVEAFRMLAGEAGQWQLRGYGMWAIEMKATGTYCGQAGLWHPEGWPEREVGWMVLAEHEGKGIAHEAALRARAYAWEELGWTRIVSCIRPANTRSIRLAERLGARFERAATIPGGIPTHVYVHPEPHAAAGAAA